MAVGGMGVSVGGMVVAVGGMVVLDGAALAVWVWAALVWVAWSMSAGFGSGGALLSGGMPPPLFGEPRNSLGMLLKTIPPFNVTNNSKT